MLRRFVISWACNVAALGAAAWLLGGVSYTGGWRTLVLAGLVFAAVNTVVRPLAIVLAIPAIILTVGVGLFFVNLLMLVLTSWLVGDYRIDGFWAAVLATIVVWLVNQALSFAGVRGLGRR